MTDSALKIRCPCGSKRHFGDCCNPIIINPVLAQAPDQLMRARYTAYCLGGYGQFLFNTWHVTQRAHLSVDELNLTGQAWCRLCVLESEKDPSSIHRGWVTFLAFFNRDGRLDVMHERSEFLLEGDRWYYLRGQQFATVVPSRKSPCLCGSGKPFKRCCGDQ